MFQWIANLLAGGVFKVFGDTIVQPLLQAYLKSKDVDLQKVQVTDTSLTTISSAILDANVRFAATQEKYIETVLNWWPFRVILFCLLLFPSIHFSMIIIDNSLTWFWNGQFGIFNVPPIKGEYLDIEKQLLLFFILVKPVDSAVTGAVNLIGKYLAKK